MKLNLKNLKSLGKLGLNIAKKHSPELLVGLGIAGMATGTVLAVKATPNPFLIQILQEYGCGCDCSSMTELMMSKALGCKEGDVMFSSNDTPDEEFKYANEIGGIINLDDITHIESVEKAGNK